MEADRHGVARGRDGAGLISEFTDWRGPPLEQLSDQIVV
jgi:hypothetical protein